MFHVMEHYCSDHWLKLTLFWGKELSPVNKVQKWCCICELEVSLIICWDDKCRAFVSPISRSVWWQVSVIALMHFSFCFTSVVPFQCNKAVYKTLCYRISVLAISFSCIFKTFLRIFPIFLILHSTFALTLIVVPAWAVCKHFCLQHWLNIVLQVDSCQRRLPISGTGVSIKFFMVLMLHYQAHRSPLYNPY